MSAERSRPARLRALQPSSGAGAAGAAIALGMRRRGGRRGRHDDDRPGGRLGAGERPPGPETAAFAQAAGRLTIGQIYPVGARRRPDHRDEPGGHARRPVLRTRSSARPADAEGARLGLRDRQGRPHRHERPRHRGRKSSRSASRTTRAQGDGRRRDPTTDLAVLAVERQLARADAARRSATPTVQVGDQVVAIGNPFGLSERSSRRASSARSSAQITAPNRLHDRPRDPDRRGDQPRQLGRPADQHARPGDRRQRADRDRRAPASGNVGIGFAIPIEHRQDRRRPAAHDRQRRACLPRRRAPQRSRPTSRGSSASPSSSGMLVEQGRAAAAAPRRPGSRAARRR